MDQPLWQNWLNVALIAFVARRAAVTLALQWDQASHGLQVLHGVVLAVCVFAAVAVWLSARWVITALATMVCVFTLASLVELASADAALRVGIVAQVVLAITAAAALIGLARRAVRAPG